MSRTNLLASTASMPLRMIRFCCDEMMVEMPDPQPGYGMPQPTVFIEELRLVIAATPVVAPVFQSQVEALATGQRYDVMLIRHGLAPEIVDPVSVDVILGAPPCDPYRAPNLSFFRTAGGELHLAPEGIGPTIALRPFGLEIELWPVHTSPDQKSDGLCRAARDIILLNRRQGAY